MKDDVALTWYEVFIGATVGIKRHIESLQRGRESRARKESTEWQYDIEGALGELAYAKWSGQYWGFTLNTFKGLRDVGSIEVRTRSRHEYELFIRPSDPDDAYFVLVTGKTNAFRIRGGYLARDAKAHPEWLKDHGNYGKPAYFVPTDQLEDLGGISYRIVHKE